MEAIRTNYNVRDSVRIKNGPHAGKVGVITRINSVRTDDGTHYNVEIDNDVLGFREYEFASV